MTHTRLTALITRRARARRVAHLRALLAPYTVAPAVIPAQRRRFVRTEVSA